MKTKFIVISNAESAVLYTMDATKTYWLYCSPSRDLESSPPLLSQQRLPQGLPAAAGGSSPERLSPPRTRNKACRRCCPTAGSWCACPGGTCGGTRPP